MRLHPRFQRRLLILFESVRRHGQDRDLRQILVRQNTKAIGRTAVELLLETIQEGPGKLREVTVRGQLIPGETVADLRA